MNSSAQRQFKTQLYGQFARLGALESLGSAPWTDCLTEDLDRHLGGDLACLVCDQRASVGLMSHFCVGFLSDRASAGVH